MLDNAVNATGDGVRWPARLTRLDECHSKKTKAGYTSASTERTDNTTLPLWQPLSPAHRPGPTSGCERHAAGPRDNGFINNIGRGLDAPSATRCRP